MMHEDEDEHEIEEDEHEEDENEKDEDEEDDRVFGQLVLVFKFATN